MKENIQNFENDDNDIDKKRGGKRIEKEKRECKSVRERTCIIVYYYLNILHVLIYCSIKYHLREHILKVFPLTSRLSNNVSVNRIYIG